MELSPELCATRYQANWELLVKRVHYDLRLKSMYNTCESHIFEHELPTSMGENNKRNNCPKKSTNELWSVAI